jgi:hypothetical protein
MADLKPKVVSDTFARMIANAARQRVMPYVKSRTLRASLRVERQRGRWFIGVPHYWAVYYHDGRGTSTPRGTWLVWYPNPLDDPRHRGRYPVRATQLRSLRDIGYSWEDVMRDVRSGRAVIAKASPRSGGGVRGNPFFVRGLRGFFNSGGTKRVQVFRDMLKQHAPELYQKRTRKVRIFV